MWRLLLRAALLSWLLVEMSVLRYGITAVAPTSGAAGELRLSRALIPANRIDYTTREGRRHRYTVRIARKVVNMATNGLGHGGSGPILATIRIIGATAIAVDPQTERVFVACEFCYRSSGSVVVLNARTGAFLRASRVGLSPLALGVDTAGGRVFVANQGGHSVSMLDAASGRVLRTVNLVGNPAVVAVSSQTGRVFVSNSDNNNVSVLDARTGNVLHTVRLSGGPFTTPMVVAERAACVFVPAPRAALLHVLDARTGLAVRTVTLRGIPGALALDEHAERVFVDTGEVLDARTGGYLFMSQIRGAIDMALDTHTNRIFTIEGSGVGTFDTRTGAAIHSVGTETEPVSGPAVIPQTGHVVVLLASPTTGSGDNVTGPAQVLVLDGRTGTLRRRLPIGAIQNAGPLNLNLLAIDGRTDRIFAIDGGGVAVLDGSRL